MGWIFLFRVHALIRDSPAYAGNTVPRAVKEILDQDHPPACAGNTPSSKMSSYAYCTSLLEPPKYLLKYDIYCHTFLLYYSVWHNFLQKIAIKQEAHRILYFMAISFFFIFSPLSPVLSPLRTVPLPLPRSPPESHLLPEARRC